MAHSILQALEPTATAPDPRKLLLLARDVLDAHFAHRDWRLVARQAAATPAQGCFVSLKVNGKLRGCIGTLQPGHPTLEEELAENTLAAATRDPRFTPLRAEELPALRLSIDLLGAQQRVASWADLDPARYGLVVKVGQRSGVLLPDIPGVATVEAQERICREKAGIRADEAVELFRFTVLRTAEEPQGLESGDER